MIPLQLHISGFLSYRDAVDIDFTAFNLACISGQNGAGKSSLLDAITWVLFGQARRRDDAIINSKSQGAEVRLDFSYENNVYRVQRGKPRDKSTLLEFYIRQPNGADTPPAWKPLTERSVRDTELRIQQTLRMDYETFTNASFFLQGKADQFATQRPGDRKRILSSILGLEIWEEYRDRAAGQRKILESENSGLDGRLSEINAELAEEPARKARLAEQEHSLDELSRNRASQETAVESLRQLTDALARQAAMVTDLETQWKASINNLESLSSRLAERQAEKQGLQDRLARAEAIELAYRDWQSAREELSGWDATAEKFREQEKSRSAPFLEIEKARHALEVEAQHLSETSASAQVWAAESVSLKAQLDLQRQAAQANMDRLQMKAVLEESVRALQQQQADARVENPRLKQEMDDLKERIDKLAESEGAQCPICGQPLSGADREHLIKELNEQGTSLANRFRQNKALLGEFEAKWKDLEQELASLNRLDGEMRAQQRQIDQAEARVRVLEEAIGEWTETGEPRLREVSQALAEGRYAQDAQIALACIDASLRELGYDAAKHDEVRRRELNGRASEAELRALENARAALTPLEREIKELDHQAGEIRALVEKQQTAFEKESGAHQAARAQAPDLASMETRLFEIREQENRLRMEVGASRQKVLVLDDLRVRKKDLETRREEISQRIGQYKTLERAFSRDGVPALLIEQALPEIESQANDLLERLSGGSMSVSFQTQREYKDKNRADLKETLDILISDGAGTRDYELFSGGEAFRVNFAIRLALSKVLSQRAGARLQTLVIDEGFGSQDAQGRQKLIEAINLVRPDFAMILVITHLEELKEFFPNRIEVEKTDRGSAVRVL